MQRLTVNGSIQPHGRLTSYYFEYGPTAEYGKKTPVRTLPPKLAAYYHESWDNGFGGWQSGLKKEHFKEGGVSGRLRPLYGAEPRRPQPRQRHRHRSSHQVPLPRHLCSLRYLGGGDADFRDAKINISVRGQNWKPNGTELLWWTQSQMNPVPIMRPDWIRPNWAYTGFLLSDYLSDGKWHQVEYRLRNDASDWSYTGGKGGYQYGSIDFCQEHMNIDFFHMIAFVNTKNPPVGGIDFDELTIAYRNKSLLLPSNGGKLEKAPEGGDDAARLTDGWPTARTKPGTARPSLPAPLSLSIALPSRSRSVPCSGTRIRNGPPRK